MGMGFCTGYEPQDQVLYRWGDAIGSAVGMPVFKSDGSNTWQEQALQAGMHHDGMEFFPLPAWSKGR